MNIENLPEMLHKWFSCVSRIPLYIWWEEILDQLIWKISQFSWFIPSTVASENSLLKVCFASSMPHSLANLCLPSRGQKSPGSFDVKSSNNSTTGAALDAEHVRPFVTSFSFFLHAASAVEHRMPVLNSSDWRYQAVTFKWEWYDLVSCSHFNR